MRENKGFFLLARHLKAQIREFFIRHNKLYTPKKALPSWISPIFTKSSKEFDEKLKYDLYEDIDGSYWAYFCGIKFGIFKKCFLYDEEYTLHRDFKTHYPKMHYAISNMLRHYSTESVVLQVKIKNNLIFGFKLYIDGIEQDVKDTNVILCNYNLQMLRVVAINQKIDEGTKESLAGQMIICNNRQHSKTFFLHKGEGNERYK